ncbi:MAG: clostripain-related cysteine peptidase [Lentisphaerota bacterium]
MKRGALMMFLLAGVMLSWGCPSVLADYGIMPVTTNTLLQWQEEQAETPDYELPSGYVGTPRVVNLLTNVTYDAKIRDQGHTGSCWMWGCQAALWMEYARQFPALALVMTNGFSVQFMSSYLTVADTQLNMGGTPYTFKRFFDAFGYAIPWGNTNAAWTDGRGYIATPPSHIYTRPNMPIYSLTLHDLPTFTATTNAAIALIKSALDAGHALYFTLTLADGDEWDKFMTFWGKTNDTETTLFTNYVSGQTLNFNTGGAHLMACVGYNDTDPNPAYHYWEFLNSWSTGDNPEDTRRPRDTWRLPMRMDYSAYVHDGMSGINSAMFLWGLLEAEFTNEVRKNISNLRVKLNAGDLGQTSIDITAPITAPGVIPNIVGMFVALNDRSFSLTSSGGVWQQVGVQPGVPPSGDLFEYTSNAGLDPAISARVDVVKKTWSCSITRLSADDVRFIDPHQGLWFNASYAQEGWGAGTSNLCETKAAAFDELTQLAQDSGIYSSEPKAATMTFTQPTNGAVFAQGDTCVIEWTQAGLDGKLLNFNLPGLGLGVTLADLVPVETGRVEWLVPLDIHSVTNQTLGASAGDSLSFNGPSISIVPSTNPALLVRAPAGGERWTTNTSRTVSWEGYNLSGDVTMELMHSGVVVAGSAVIVAASAGRAVYALPGDLEEGGYALRFGASGLSVTGAIFTVTGEQPVRKRWTVLVYFDADNNLEAGQMVDFLNIAQVGSTSNVNVLAQMDRVPGYYIGYDNWYGARRFYMTNGITPALANTLQDLGEVSIARADTLTDFINWGVENFPAEQYLLALCDHGHGLGGALQDYTPNQSAAAQPMTLLQRALTNAVTNLTIVGYDCCNMGILDAAYQLRNCGAAVFIGSQYQETKGWAYAPFLRELENAKGRMSARAAATRLCDLSVAMYDPQDPAALTAVDLNLLPALAGAMAGFADAMIADPEDRTAIRLEAAATASNYYEGIVHHAANRQTERLTTGLNAYFPKTGPDEYLDDELDFKDDAHWLAFLQAFTNTLKDTWIGEARELLGDGTEFDLMRFVNAINPPDDAVWLSVSQVGRGSIDGLPPEKNLQFRKGEVIQLAARGDPPFGVDPATHFVRWWVSGGANFSNALTEATNTLTLTDHATLIACFSADQSNYNVDVSAIGNGAINGQGEPFSLNVPNGSNAPALFATASTGCVFAGWGGDVDETANPLIISNVIADLAVYGLFFEAPDAWSNHADTTWWQAGPTNFTLTTAQQLAGLAQLVNNGTDAFSNKVVMLATNVNLADKEWTAIGTSARPYAGSFNGQGFTIAGLSIQKTEANDYQGLFGVVGGAGSIVLENIHMTNTTIVAGGFVGGIAGRVEAEAGSILVRNCSNAGSVWGYGSLVGGLAGELITGEEGGAITVSNCANSSEVRGEADTGGLAGRMLANGEVCLRDSSNEGGIIGSQSEVGGLAGAALSLSAAVSVEACFNTGGLAADAEMVGGMAGKMSGGDTTLNGCENRGHVTVTGAGHQYAGGLVGYLGGMMPTLKNCRNAGEVFGNALVGGVAGQAAVSMHNCSNEGRVEGDDAVGGVAGAVVGETAVMANCHNAGAVISTGRVGGVAGRIASSHGAAADSLYYLKTAGTNASLPFVGDMVPATNLTNCATFAGLDGALSTNGYGNKTLLVNALNTWVSEQSGAFFWSTNREGTLVYPYPDPALTHVVITFFANGGLFVGGATTTGAVYELGQPYGAFPGHPARTNHAFVGWWYAPEPGVDPAKLVVDLTAVPAVTWVDAWWSTTVRTATPLPVSVETLAEYYPAVATMTEEQINALANGMAANGRDKVWELVFLGLDPTDDRANPHIVFVYMLSNPFRVFAVPETPIEGSSKYTVQGKERLDAAAWVNVGAPGEIIPENYRFLRVVGE